MLKKSLLNINSLFEEFGHPKWQSSFLLILFFQILIAFMGGIISVYLIPVLIITGILLYFSFKSKQNIFLFYIFILPLLPILPPVINVALTVGIFFTICVIWCLTHLDWKNIHPMPNDISLFFISFLLFSCFSTIFSQGFMSSFIELVRYFSIFLLVFILFQHLHSINEIVKILYISVISTIIMVIISLPEVISLGPSAIITGAVSENRLASFYGNPNNFAVPFILSVPVLISLFVFKKYSRFNFIKKSIIFFVLLFFIYIVLLTNSRSALLSIMASTGFIMLTFKTGRRLVLFFITAFLLILPFIFEFLFFALRLERGFTGRDILWKAAIDMIKDYPLLGVGPGMYEMVKYKYIIPTDFLTNMTRLKGMSGAAHNHLLTYTAEGGIFVGMVWLVFLVTIVTKIIILTKTKLPMQDQFIFVASASTIIGLLVRSFFECGVIIGSGRINDSIYFLIPLVIVYKIYEKHIAPGKINL